MQQGMQSLMRGMIGNLLLVDCGIPAGKEFKMIVTGVIVAGIVLYAIWAVRKVRRDHRNGSCCGGSCPGCTETGYCSK